jgi:hypothetical protein
VALDERMKDHRKSDLGDGKVPWNLEGKKGPAVGHRP